MSEARATLPQPQVSTTRAHQDPVLPPPLHSLPVQPLQESVAAAISEDREAGQQATRSGVSGKKLKICTSTVAKEDVQPKIPASTSSTGVPHCTAFGPGSWSSESIEYTEKPDDGYEANANQYYGLDVEKQSYNGYNMSSGDEYLGFSDRPATAASSVRDTQTEPENEVEKHMRSILIYLSLLSPLLTTFISIYALLALSILALLSPIRLFSSQPRFSIHLSRALLPTLHLQLALIHSSCPATAQPAISTLLLVLFGSPVYALAIAVASWVAAGFWCYAAILGEPNQEGKRDDDGRRAAGAVRRWWEIWLLRGVGGRGGGP